MKGTMQSEAIVCLCDDDANVPRQHSLQEEGKEEEKRINGLNTRRENKNSARDETWQRTV